MQLKYALEIDTGIDVFFLPFQLTYSYIYMSYTGLYNAFCPQGHTTWD